jgi:TrmH family RNA methyltransferase
VVEKERDAKRGTGTSHLPLLDPSVDLPAYTLEKDMFNELSDVRSGTGLLGVARIPPAREISSVVSPDKSTRFIFLDGIQEPGNVGTLIRTAWALGFSGVLTGPGTADPYSRKGVRSSAGAVFHLPLFEEVDRGKMDALEGDGFLTYFAEGGAPDYRKANFSDRAILVLGNEGAGVSGWLRERGTAVGIPMAEGVDSLNVVVAGGIIAAAMISD